MATKMHEFPGTSTPCHNDIVPSKIDVSSLADASGGSGFMQVSVPRAALLLAQGTGRLIRSIDDRGVVAILDSRIVTKRYGSVLLNSMPPLWRTSDGAIVRDSLKRLRDSL